MDGIEEEREREGEPEAEEMFEGAEVLQAIVEG